MTWKSWLWCYWVSWSAFKQQSLKKNIQPSPLVRAGDLISVYQGWNQGIKQGSTIMFATARTCPGILPGIQPLCFQEVLINESPDMFPKAGKITWHICWFAETREMTTDSSSILTGPGTLHACSPVLGLRDDPHGQQSSYIYKNIG